MSARRPETARVIRAHLVIGSHALRRGSSCASSMHMSGCANYLQDRARFAPGAGRPPVALFATNSSRRKREAGVGTLFETRREPMGDGRVRLVVEGELDVASAWRLEAQLSELARRRASVLLDLTAVTFVDSA